MSLPRQITADPSPLSPMSSRILSFLTAHNTLTLATIGPKGRPHACALFYAVGPGPTLYFLSDPATTHAQHIGAGSQIAAAIQQDGQDWREIRGLQLHGFAAPCLTANEKATAHQIYAARFPFVATASRLAEALARARYYQIAPSWMRLTDNTLGFGHKEEWQGA
ncbi:MAG TPA: pyridoxamine 5'-phosphate oxidase [Caldilineae bacterium]|nr:pyridoxamine 5'-phosphate oxidase [Caldilineae bacterium]